MKVIILAGGLGTRLSEETELKPKPMVEIGGHPIIWHIMNTYAHYGFNDFVICLGYKGYMIKEFFANYFIHNSDITIDLEKNSVQVLNSNSKKWKVTLVDTGLDTMTAGRIKRVSKYLEDSTFMMTYGDGVSNIDISELHSFHKEHGKIGTITAVQPPGRFGSLKINDNYDVKAFEEKPTGDNAWISGGFFVLEPEILDFIKGDDTIFEKEPLETLAAQGQLAAFKHRKFWKSMDTLRDKKELELLWKGGNPPWKVW